MFFIVTDNIAYLDYQRRNKPKEPPKMQKLAPFFLSNTNNLLSGTEGTKNPDSRVLDSSSTPFAMPLTPWAEKLNSAQKPDECRPFSFLYFVVKYFLI